MTLALNNSVGITKTIVPGHKRSSALPDRFPGLFLVYEMLVYRYKETFCQDYSGGYWDFVELSNGGFFMSLRSSQPCKLIIPANGFEGVMTAEAASIVINIFALSRLAKEHKMGFLIDMYYALRDFACDHQESYQILSAIEVQHG